MVLIKLIPDGNEKEALKLKKGSAVYKYAHSIKDAFAVEDNDEQSMDISNDKDGDDGDGGYIDYGVQVAAARKHLELVEEYCKLAEEHKMSEEERLDPEAEATLLYWEKLAKQARDEQEKKQPINNNGDDNGGEKPQQPMSLEERLASVKQTPVQTWEQTFMDSRFTNVQDCMLVMMIANVLDIPRLTGISAKASQPHFKTKSLRALCGELGVTDYEAFKQEVLPRVKQEHQIFSPIYIDGDAGIDSDDEDQREERKQSERDLIQKTNEEMMKKMSKAESHAGPNGIDRSDGEEDEDDDDDDDMDE